MGADGGITWVRVRDMPRFMELILPFNLHWQKGSDWGDSSRWEYLQQHSELKTDYFISTYGTDVSHSGTDTLRDMLSDADNDVFAEMNFIDLYLDVVTSPYYWSDAVVYGHNIVDVLKEQVFWRAKYTPKYSVEELVRQASHVPILNMPIYRWGKQVRETIDVNSFDSVETWT